MMSLIKSLRARAQEEIINPCPPNTPKSDLEIEAQEIIKLYEFSKLYPDVQIYFKADNPERAIQLRNSSPGLYITHANLFNPDAPYLTYNFYVSSKGGISWSNFRE